MEKREAGAPCASEKLVRIQPTPFSFSRGFGLKTTIDFETRSEADIKKVGAWEYSLHPTTEVLCLAYKTGEEKTLLLDLHRCKTPFKLPGLIEAHNAFFEKAIYQNILVKKYGWPEIDESRWRCSMAKAAACGLPAGLGDLADALSLPIKKDAVGNRLMLQLCKPRPDWNKNGDWKTDKAGNKIKVEKWFDDADRMQRLYEYCIQDVEAEHAASKRLPELSEKELKVWQIDQRINLRGVAVDRVTCEAALDTVAKTKKIGNKRMRELTGVSATQPELVRKWLNKNHGLELKDLTKDSVSKALDSENLAEDAREVLTIRKQISQASTAKIEQMTNRSGIDGRARDLFRYHGANQTGRFAGKAIQLQNLPRG